jgi:hydroxyquinol 1,2-dioxygenase
LEVPVLNLDENTITTEALRRMQNTSNPRLKRIMASLVQHLHDFAREVELSESEWFDGIAFLTAVGNMTTGKRQEFILLSDVLGLSTLVIAQSHRKPADCTEATVFGPFHVDGAPEYPLGADLANGAQGEPCFVDVTLRGVQGEPVTGATVDVWQSDAAGYYDVQYEGNDVHRGRGILHSDAQGRVYFKTILPVAYPIPTDGPVGRMLEATGRHPWRPAHIHFMIVAPGYEKLVTHVFRNDDIYLDSDAVFGVRSSLLGTYRRHEAGSIALDGKASAAPYYTLQYDFVLNPRPAALAVATGSASHAA